MTGNRDAAYGKEYHGYMRRLCSVIVTLAVMAAAAVLVAAPAQAVPLPPPNPTDQEIQESEANAEASASEVGRLAGVVSSTQSKIQQLRDAMELKAELAMKARVDLEMAQHDAAEAEQAATDAQQVADDAGDAISGAQEQAAEFAAASFRQGSVAGSMTALLDADSMDELLARRQMIEQVSGNQAGVLETLQTARTNKANLDSKAKAALADATDAKDAAQEAQLAADQAQDAAAQAFSDGQSQLDALQSKLEGQQDDYQSALNQVSDLRGQRAQYNAWVQAKQEEEQRLAEQAALQRKQAAQLQKEQAQAEAQQQAEEKNRTVAIGKEKVRQDQIQKERARKAAAAEAARKAAAKEAARKAAAAEAARKAAAADAPAAKPPAQKPPAAKPPAKRPSAPSTGSRGNQVVQAALKWLGTTYAWGGGTASGPSRGIRDGGTADYYGDYNKTGFDCSGLALYAWAQVGVYLPHYSGYQFNYGTRVASSNLQPGDLVFYAHNTSNPNTIHHVAIYMGNNQMIEAPQSGMTVRIRSMRWNGYIGASRPGA